MFALALRSYNLLHLGTPEWIFFSIKMLKENYKHTDSSKITLYFVHFVEVSALEAHTFEILILVQRFAIDLDSL